MPKQKTQPKRKSDKIDLSGLNPADFRPVSRETLGKGLVRLATVPKKKKR